MNLDQNTLIGGGALIGALLLFWPQLKPWLSKLLGGAVVPPAPAVPETDNSEQVAAFNAVMTLQNYFSKRNSTDGLRLSQQIGAALFIPKEGTR